MKEIIDTAAEIAEGLSPPDPDAPKEDQQRWRWWIMIVVGVNSVGLAIHIALACGLTPFYSGFAKAADMESIHAQNRTARLEQLQWRMFELRVKQCEAIAKGESPRAFTVQLEEQQRTYLALTNGTYSLPDCRELK